MKFQKFLLDDYLHTEDGKKVFTFFCNFSKKLVSQRRDFIDFVDARLEIPLAEETYDKGFLDYIEEWLGKLGHKKYINIDSYIDAAVKLTNVIDYSDRNYQWLIPLASVWQSVRYPEYAFPYLFPQHFYKITQICEIFEIPLPRIPGKTRHWERLIYYWELCRTLYDFRKYHRLSSVELWTFLYGFSPRFLDGYLHIDLPEANRVYLIGASKEDVRDSLIKKYAKGDINCWQGCSEIFPGDIILLYELAPYKRIGSIWRAISSSFDDPFHYYPGKIFMRCELPQLPLVTYEDLLHDPVWSKNSLVRCNMQGIGFKNTSINHDEYEAFKKLLKKKKSSFNLKQLPTPPPYARFFHPDLQSEKDVEKKLLEPFLEKIGYNVQKEFIRQFSIRMGRGICYYPDYALHATGKNGDEKADFIWEAKYRISTTKQLMEDLGQAKSYAWRLACYGLGLVSIEGIWISLLRDHFDFNKMHRFSWNELEDYDIFSGVKTLFYSLCKPS